MSQLIRMCGAMALSAAFAASPQSQRPVAAGKSPNWSVSVVAARKKAYSDQYYQLVLDLRFEYLGSGGEVAAPRIAVTDERGKRYEPAVDTRFAAPAGDIGLALWLSSSVMAQQMKRSLKSGDTFGFDEPLTYEFVPLIPIGSKTLTLIFADVDPVTIRPVESK